MASIKKWFCTALLLFSSTYRAEAAQPVFLMDAFGHPISSTLSGGAYYLDVNASLSEVATAASGAAGPSLLKVIAGEDGGGLVRPLLTDTSGKLQITASSASVGATGSSVPASADYIGVKDGSGNLFGLTFGQTTMSASIPVAISSNQSAIPASQSGTWNVTNVSGTVSLPTGAATGTKQDTGNTSLASIDSKLPAALDGSGYLKTHEQGTAAVSAVSLPLPSGASTAANQTSVQGSVSGGSAATSSVAVGGVYNSSAPTLTNGQQASLQLNVSGSLKVDGSAVTQPVSISGNQAINLVQVAGASVATGAGTASGSVRVELPTNGTGVVGLNAGTNLIGYTKTTDGTNFMPTMDVVGRPGFQKITDGTNTMPTMDTVGRAGFHKITDGTNTAAVKAASTAAAATDPALVVTVSPNSTAPANVTQIGGATLALGQTTKSASVPVTIASDQVAPKTYANSAGSQTTGTVSTVITLSAPASAVGFLLQAKDSNTANMRWAVGATATTTVGQQIQPGRDTGYIPVGANVSIVSESGTQEYEIQWVTQ